MDELFTLIAMMMFSNIQYDLAITLEYDSDVTLQ